MYQIVCNLAFALWQLDKGLRLKLLSELSAISLFHIRDWPVDSGRPFTLKDVNGATEVWILGMTAMENLFGGIDLIGQIVRIKNVPFSVISVLTHKGQTGHGDDKHDGFWLARMLRLGILPPCFY